jgi:hypothetical protein
MIPRSSLSSGSASWRESFREISTPFRAAHKVKKKFFISFIKALGEFAYHIPGISSPFQSMTGSFGRRSCLLSG